MFEELDTITLPPVTVLRERMETAERQAKLLRGLLRVAVRNERREALDFEDRTGGGGDVRASDSISSGRN